MRSLRLLTTILLTAAFAMGGCKPESDLRTKEDVESFLQKHVAPGASRESVVAMLDANRIEHSGARDPGSIYAIVRVPDDKATVKRALQIKFDFGADGKLSKYSVVEKFTGP